MNLQIKLSLIIDFDRREKIGKNARELIEKKYDWMSIVKEFHEEVIEAI